MTEIFGLPLEMSDVMSDRIVSNVDSVDRVAEAIQVLLSGIRSVHSCAFIIIYLLDW